MKHEIVEAKTTEIQKPEQQALAVQSQSPVMQLADKLASGTITAEQMEKMLDVQMKWEKHEAEKAYHVAMGKFQENTPAIIKSKKGHNCMHADLAIDIVAKVAPLLSEQGLSHKWITKSVEGGVEVTCKITHIQGHSESTSMFAGPDTSGSKNAIQAIGSTVTYLQRYTLKSALGLAEGGQDDDGDGSGKKTKEIPFPTDLEIECLDAIIKELKSEREVDRGKLANFFLVEKGKYPTTKARVIEATEFVMQKSPNNIYVKETK